MTGSDPSEKWCGGCGETKAAAEFFRCSRRADGLQTRCKACQIKVRRENNRLNPERQAAHARASRERNRDGFRAKRVAFDNANPEKIRARNLLTSAVRYCRIVRPDACEECGKTCHPDGHHEDYSRPLDVRWLCRLCHHAEHRPHLKEAA